MRARLLGSIGAVCAVATLLGSALPARASDLVEVQAVVEGQFPGPDGGLVVQLEWGVRNISTDAEVTVVLNAYIVYANGLRQQVFPPEVATLAPADAIIRLGFVIVPDAAGAGTATFYAEARVGRISGGDGSGRFASDTDTFDVP